MEIYMIIQRFFSPILAMLFVLTGCASKMSSDRYREGSNEGQNVELSVDQEKHQCFPDHPPVDHFRFFAGGDFLCSILYREAGRFMVDAGSGPGVIYGIYIFQRHFF